MKYYPKAKYNPNKYKVRRFYFSAFTFLLFGTIASLVLQSLTTSTKVYANSLEPISYSIVRSLNEFNGSKYQIMVDSYPSDTQGRINAIKSYLAGKLSNNDINMFLQIIKMESNYNDQDLGMGIVKHCQRSNGNYYAIELGNCGNDTQVGAERSFGMLQILPSTWRLYSCTGSQEFWKDQLNCGLKIHAKSGFWPWSTYRVILSRLNK